MIKEKQDIEARHALVVPADTNISAARNAQL